MDSSNRGRRYLGPEDIVAKGLGRLTATPRSETFHKVIKCTYSRSITGADTFLRDNEDASNFWISEKNAVAHPEWKAENAFQDVRYYQRKNKQKVWVDVKCVRASRACLHHEIRMNGRKDRTSNKKKRTEQDNDPPKDPPSDAPRPSKKHKTTREPTARRDMVPFLPVRLEDQGEINSAALKGLEEALVAGTSQGMQVAEPDTNTIEPSGQLDRVDKAGLYQAKADDQDRQDRKLGKHNDITPRALLQAKQQNELGVRLLCAGDLNPALWAFRGALDILHAYEVGTEELELRTEEVHEQSCIPPRWETPFSIDDDTPICLHSHVIYFNLALTHHRLGVAAPENKVALLNQAVELYNQVIGLVKFTSKTSVVLFLAAHGNKGDLIPDEEEIAGLLQDISFV